MVVNSAQNRVWAPRSRTRLLMSLYSLSLAHKPTTSVKLGHTDVLKLTFKVAQKENEEGIQPHQTFLRFYDETTGEEGIQPIKVTPAGKAKFELVCFRTYHLMSRLIYPQNMARPPSSLPPSADAPLKVSLLLGSFVHDPAKFELFDLVVPPSQPAPQHPDEVLFHPLPEIQHQFRPEQKLPPSFISAVFAALVVGPWAVLLGLVCAHSQLNILTN